MAEDGLPAVNIREVWGYNLEQEFGLIRYVVDRYPYVGMDTEFPGVALESIGDFKNDNEYKYQCVKDNVAALKLIQLGFTFADGDGNLPTCGAQKGCVWQFNFKFHITQDIYLDESVEFLNKSGINFEKHGKEGIDANVFAELLISSGVVMNHDVHWVTFHSTYDFAYLLKLLTSQDLPETIQDFYELVKTYFPVLYDMKYLILQIGGFRGGLQELADFLGVKRIGTSHQAGSDSLLTLQSFKKLKDEHFNGSLETYQGVVFGIRKSLRNIK